MNNTMEYKGYVGTIEFSEEDCLLFGQVLGIKSLISYEGSTAKELLEDFHTAVDDYLEVCSANGMEPERSYKGSFNVRVNPELHKEAAIRALAEGISLNSLVERAISGYMVSGRGV